jgi:hypothetical protein
MLLVAILKQSCECPENSSLTYKSACLSIDAQSPDEKYMCHKCSKMYVKTSMSKSKLYYMEMHGIYTDPNKMLFFHVVAVLCNALFTSFDKLLYASTKTSFCSLSKPEMHRLLHLVVVVKSSSSQCFLQRVKHLTVGWSEVWTVKGMIYGLKF